MNTEEKYNRYVPIPGGFRLRLNKSAPPPDQHSDIGVVTSDSDPRQHRRPLYSAADKRVISHHKCELAKIERCGFRPLVLAYMAPRFVFDYHSAGGLLGQLLIGLKTETSSKWLHDWDDIDISYVEGRMEYVLQDADFPGATVSLSATALATAAGLAVKIEVAGATGASLIWTYGGASAFFSNWALDGPAFSFSPEQCVKDSLQCQGIAFTLTRSFADSDAYMNEVFAVRKYLPQWKAQIHGGSSWDHRVGFGSPEAVLHGPAKLLETVEYSSSAAHNRVAVQEIPLDETATGHITIGMGGDMEDHLWDPDVAYEEALARNDEIANRIVVNTPDPYLNSAVTMMAFATDGIWGDTSILHGGWSWRFAYLGWRAWYGPTCYGWTDRIKKSIQNHIRLGLVREGPDAGALGALIEYDPAVYYNMNEVFFDHVRHYFEYTNDIELMREIFPTLVGIAEWEDRRLQPDNENLYEGALNTWISDQHWYIRGQCTQASAYMFNAYRLLADLAKRLGRDSSPFEERVTQIHSAMHGKLWMRRQGVFAEYKDTRGNRLLHPEPELPTIYHSAEFRVADMLEIYQMLHWADTHLPTVETPGGGKQYWSSNWFPNVGRSYTHSTYELAYAEELNFSLANYLGGRADEAYAIIRASLCGIFNGRTPGGLSCHSHTDGRQRANDEFADAISMWGRTIYEGLFGIAIKRPDGVVDLCPQFPSDWPKASIKSPHFSYEWERSEGKISIRWNSPVKTRVNLRLPIHASAITSVTVDDEDIDYRCKAGVGLTWLRLQTQEGESGTIEISYAPLDVSLPGIVRIKPGEEIRAKAADWLDPQGILSEAQIQNGQLQGSISPAEPGPALLFAMDGTEPCPRWTPVRLEILPEKPEEKKIWSPPNMPKHDLSCWNLIDLSSVFNARVPEVMDRVAAAAKPPEPPASVIGFEYYLGHLVPPFVTPTPSDEAWRAKIGANGIGWTADGIPFKSPREGDNIAAVTLVAEFPESLEFPVNAAGKTLYLMLSGTTFAMQSHVVNLRITLSYADGELETHDLVNPFDIGDCWNQYRFHDTAANGFENLGGRFGPAGSIEVDDMTEPIRVDTEAHLVSFPLRQGIELQAVRIEAIANDIIFGVMGASILR